MLTVTEMSALSRTRMLGGPGRGGRGTRCDLSIAQLLQSQQLTGQLNGIHLRCSHRFQNLGPFIPDYEVLCLHINAHYMEGGKVTVTCCTLPTHLQHSNLSTGSWF